MQKSILLPIPDQGRYLEFSARHDSDVKSVLGDLAGLDLRDDLVIGLGAGLVMGLGGKIEGLHGFKALSGPGCEVPSTQADLFCWVRGENRADVARLAREFVRVVEPAFDIVEATDGFKYKSGLDLTGYEDGTENPKGDDATKAAFVAGKGAGLDGSSFVSVQKWLHDMDVFDDFTVKDSDDIIGRRLSDNVEFEGSPEFAHVKRTAQESFSPEAFILRRSMPWSDGQGEGLMFVSFGNSFYGFEAQLGRMTGQEDGIVDGLFRFSRPVSGANYWCPPLKDGKLDLSAIGVSMV